MISLDIIDYQIFLHLRDNPLISLNELSKTLNITYHQARERIFKMKASGFLRPDHEINDPLLGKRKRTEVEASYRPHKLGLQRIHVILQGIPSPTCLQALFKLADDHPYTHYKTMVFSPQPSIYYQFDIPPQTLQTHIKLFQTLKEHNVYQNLIIFPTQETSTSKLNFSYWDQFQHKWSLSQNKKTHLKNNLNPLQTLWETMKHENTQPIPKTKYSIPPQKTPKLDELDLALFRELSINAKVSQKELAEYYNKNTSTINKRLKKLMSKQELLATLYYNHLTFNINEQVIIIGTLKEKTLMPYFHTFIRNNYFPFTSTFISEQARFFWYLNLPYGVFTDLLYFLWDKTTKYQVFRINFKMSSTYYFYPHNYDLSNHTWKTSDDYILHAPLQQFLNYCKK